jgi:hypothetical protein
MRTKVLLESLKGTDHSDDLGVDKRIILKWILGNRVWKCGLDSSGPRYRDRWRDLKSTAMNLRVPQNADYLSASQDGLCYMELVNLTDYINFNQSMTQ